jgi:tRNA 2-selenouridine synthase
MVEKRNINDFLKLTGEIPLIDVRSPAEFAQGHIPGAINLPLFNNEERTIVGTLYKQSGREASVLRGLEFVGPKMPGFVKAAVKIAPKRKLMLHCWRGGMRSESMAWLFSTTGFQIYLLNGGYKAYRSFIRSGLEAAEHFIILSGKTGSGKTEVLREMKKMGVQVIDLEGLANHKGSAFGALGEDPQPTNEQFENDLYKVYSELDPGQPVFLEDESRSIGKVVMPEGFFQIMRSGPVIRLEMGAKLRVERLVVDYSKYPKEQLIESVNKIEKRIGGQNANKIVAAIEAEDFHTAIDMVLGYYDKTYNYGLTKRENPQIHYLETNTINAEYNAKLVINFFKKNMFKLFNYE